MFVGCVAGVEVSVSVAAGTAAGACANALRLGWWTCSIMVSLASLSASPFLGLVFFGFPPFLDMVAPPEPAVPAVLCDICCERPGPLKQSGTNPFGSAAIIFLIISALLAFIEAPRVTCPTSMGPGILMKFSNSPATPPSMRRVRMSRDNCVLTSRGCTPSGGTQFSGSKNRLPDKALSSHN